jgi:predicted P-loop ATPase
MAKKTQKCPYFSRRKTGKWIRLSCSIPEGMPCPNPRCQANPDFQEPVPDAGE